MTNIIDSLHNRSRNLELWCNIGKENESCENTQTLAPWISCFGVKSSFSVWKQWRTDLNEERDERWSAPDPTVMLQSTATMTEEVLSKTADRGLQDLIQITRAEPTYNVCMSVCVIQVNPRNFLLFLTNHDLFLLLPWLHFIIDWQH